MDHQTTIEQLGGRMFVAMTGAKQFVASQDTLRFRVGNNAKKVSTVTITLDPNDTYSMRTYREMRMIQETIGVYADMLPGIFTKMTGLSTSL